MPARELLPRDFTLIRQLTDGIISVVLSVFTVFSRESFPLGSMAPCVVPTFLLQYKWKRQSGPPAVGKGTTNLSQCVGWIPVKSVRREV